VDRDKFALPCHYLSEIQTLKSSRGSHYKLIKSFSLKKMIKNYGQKSKPNCWTESLLTVLELNWNSSVQFNSWFINLIH